MTVLAQSAMSSILSNVPIAGSQEVSYLALDTNRQVHMHFLFVTYNQPWTVWWGEHVTQVYRLSQRAICLCWFSWKELIAEVASSCTCFRRIWRLALEVGMIRRRSHSLPCLLLLSSTCRFPARPVAHSRLHCATRALVSDEEKNATFDVLVTNGAKWSQLMVVVLLFCCLVLQLRNLV